MNYETSFALSQEQDEAVKATLNLAKEKYKKIAHIVCESEMKIGEFFEYEISEER